MLRRGNDASVLSPGADTGVHVPLPPGVQHPQTRTGSGPDAPASSCAYPPQHRAPRQDRQGTQRQPMQDDVQRPPEARARQRAPAHPGDEWLPADQRHLALLAQQAEDALVVAVLAELRVVRQRAAARRVGDELRILCPVQPRVDERPGGKPCAATPSSSQHLPAIGIARRVAAIATEAVALGPHALHLVFDLERRDAAAVPPHRRLDGRHGAQDQVVDIEVEQEVVRRHIFQRAAHDVGLIASNRRRGPARGSLRCGARTRGRGRRRPLDHPVEPAEPEGRNRLDAALQRPQIRGRVVEQNPHGRTFIRTEPVAPQSRSGTSLPLRADAASGPATPTSHRFGSATGAALRAR